MDGQGRSDKEHLSIQPFSYINAFNSQFFIILFFEILDREIMFWRVIYNSLILYVTYFLYLKKEFGGFGGRGVSYRKLNKMYIN